MTFRILSLDGGGTWALLQAMALGDLYPGLGGRRILGQFDLAVANSGGSIVLAGLMLDFAPDRIADFFLDQTSREAIFHKRPLVEEALAAALPIFPKYSAAEKRTGLAAVFGATGNIRLADWPSTSGWPVGPAGAAVRVLIPAFDYDRLREDFLRSYEVPRTGATAETTTLVDAVHGSTNAPVTFFDAPAMVGGRRYWDGAMGGYNNPLMAGVVDAIALDVEPQTITALSIGSGTVRLAPPDLAPPATPPDLKASLAAPGIVGDSEKAARCITDDPPDAATYVAHVVLGNAPAVPGRVVRMNPVVQPVRDFPADPWRFPAGLPAPLFDALANLGMDAVAAADVANIRALGEAWLSDRAPNQPIRMGDDLGCAVGHPTYGAAKAHWLTL